MRAILLAGGKGTRLQPFTATFPKPLVPLDDVPVIEVPFLVMNGDLLTTLDFNALIALHKAQRPMATIATYPKKVTIDLGVVEMDERGYLTEYREKPSHDFFVSMGIYCFQPEVCDYVRPGERISMPELILRLRSAGQQVLCCREDCYWLDIGRPDDYALAVEEFRRDRWRFLPSRAAA